MKFKVKHLLSQCLFLLLMVGMSSFAMAQATVTGKVTDANSGEGLIGATVVVKDASGGTVTDIEGNYSISVPEGGTTLVFTYTGYSKKEVAINGQSVINVSLAEGIDVTELEIVGYATVKKSDVTGAVATVTEKDFNKGIVTAPDQLIQGKVAGVQMINNSGQPGGGTTVRIRGNSSIRAGSQPLYVVDGVPLDNSEVRPGGGAGGGDIGGSAGSNPLSFINPNDIASMEILKDASATAIYGSRGANGVVLITTKRGKTGAPSIDFGTGFGSSSILKNYDVLTGDQYRQALTDNGITAGDFGSSVDAMDEILQTALTQNYNFSIGGGSDAGRYRVSASYLDQQGIVKETGLKKYTASLNGQYKFLDNKVGLDFNLNASHTIENLAPIGTNSGALGSLIGQALQWNPTENLYDVNGIKGFNIKAGDQINPVAMLAAHNDVANVSNILGSISPYVKLADGLEYRFLYSVRRGLGNRRASMASFINIPNIDGNGEARVENNLLTTQQYTHTLNYNKDLTEKVTLNAVVGYEYQKYDFEGSGMYGRGFVTDVVDYGFIMQNTDRDTRDIYGYANPTNELQSIFARGVFNIDQKYVITATVRRDGSSKFGTNNKYGVFPSIAGSWNLASEGFLPEDINSLKLRASWGITGNQEFPAGAATERYGFRADRGFDIINFANDNLKWETTTSYNIGIDFGILNDKITGSIDYFNKNTSDLLFPKTAAAPAPAGIVWSNIEGNIINSGVEIALMGYLVSNENFSWSLGANVTFQQNMVENYNPLANEELGGLFGQGLSGATTQRLSNGYPLNVYYLPVYEGLDDNGFSILANDGKKQYLGSPNPTTLLGISTTVSAGKFDATLNFNGAMGQYIYNNTANAVLSIGNLGSRNIDANLLGTGESTANIPSPSTRYLEKGDYLKLANMTLGYAVGDVGSIKNVRISLTGQNLLIFTNYTGFDPEINTVNVTSKGIPSFGIEYAPYPSVRSVLFGISCSL